MAREIAPALDRYYRALMCSLGRHRIAADDEKVNGLLWGFCKDCSARFAKYRTGNLYEWRPR